MPPSVHTRKRLPRMGLARIRLPRLGLPGTCVLAALFLGVSGCATFWDDLTSKDIPWQHRLKYAMTKKDPAKVLAESDDGTLRSRALCALKEPLQHGGTQADQDYTIDLLRRTALEDRDPLCRLGAIKALSSFKDPRVVEILESAYLRESDPPLMPEYKQVIRQNALAGLEKTGHPEARKLLVTVARQPTSGADTSYFDRQQTNDERLTAIRALANFNQADSVDALVYVLETEKDVALRDRAHQSLKKVTGKNLPAEAVAWRELFLKGPDALQERRGFADAIMAPFQKSVLGN